MILTHTRRCFIWLEKAQFIDVVYVVNVFKIVRLKDEDSEL